MKKLAVVALAAAVAGLPACTTMHKDRRTMTDWNMGLLREKVDPCGTSAAHGKNKAQSGDCKAGANFNAEGTGPKLIEYVTVKPIALAMLPVSWLTDTVILNPINAFKRAELETHDRKYCAPEHHPEWSDAQADEHAYGVVPPVTPWPVGYVLTAPEFAGRWVWNSLFPTAPVNDAKYEAYWHEHNEE